MNFPSDLKYDKSHEWVRIDGTTGTIGITEYAQSELGDVVFVDITASIGDDVAPGQVFGTIEAVKTVADLYMPIAGRIIEINEAINDAPETVNNAPYGDGWMVKIEIAADADVAGLMNAEAYAASVGQ
ncbi:MAG: glycine cleavage system protein GcvH [Chlorobi bacterium]|nr:MAG: glycine cleavage system H protein [Chlorobi bacterium OLB7]MBK8912073.1 glycine cleavage system protein GcvH [Chlorobiota bacterium]MBX7217152.1 glycine cleavage system protein GcvH [Candidatus Kapabacteria bacterium]